MADKQDGFPLLLEFIKLMIALGLEKHVADRQCLIDDQNLRLNVNRDRESQADEHAAGIGFYGLIDEFPDISEFDDVFHPRINLFLREAHNRTVQVDVLHARVFLIEAGPQLQQGGYSSVDPYLALRRGKDTGDDL